MSQLPIFNGIPYLPDSYTPQQEPKRPWPAWLRIALFITCYVGLQTLYALCAGTAVERFLLEDLGSRPAAAVIHVLQPSLEVTVSGSRVGAAQGGGINIGNGCEGSDLYILLVSAFIAAPMAWRARLSGLGTGLLLAFTLNQLRIVGLFHAFRTDRELFDLLHTTVIPVVLVVAIALFFHAWLRHGQRPAKTSA